MFSAEGGTQHHSLVGLYWQEHPPISQSPSIRNLCALFHPNLSLKNMLAYYKDSTNFHFHNIGNILSTLKHLFKHLSRPSLAFLWLTYINY